MTDKTTAMPERFTKKPVTIEAFQMTEARRMSNHDWPEWLHKAWNKEEGQPGALFRQNMDAPLPDILCIQTLEGVHLVNWGDWIIQGVKGELYPCKPDIFELTYDRAALQSAQPAAPGVTGAMQTLIETLKADPEYAWAWHCNVAMATFDEGLSHYAANKAAARFLSWLAQIDTTTHPGFPKAPAQPAAAVSDEAILALRHAQQAPEWDGGKPANLQAAARDADEWLALIQRLNDAGRWLFSQPDSRPKLDGCRAALSKILCAPAQQAVPMTRAQRLEVFRKAEDRMAHDINLCWRNALIEETEAHHGITQRADGGEV